MIHSKPQSGRWYGLAFTQFMDISDSVTCDEDIQYWADGYVLSPQVNLNVHRMWGKLIRDTFSAWSPSGVYPRQ